MSHTIRTREALGPGDQDPFLQASLHHWKGECETWRKFHNFDVSWLSRHLLIWYRTGAQSFLSKAKLSRPYEHVLSLVILTKWNLLVKHIFLLEEFVDAFRKMIKHLDEWNEQ